MIDYEGITKCILEYINEKKVTPWIISFTFSFGVLPEENIELPELLIGTLTVEDIQNNNEEINDFAWNPVEYSHFEIHQKCINKYFQVTNERKRAEFLESFLKQKGSIQEKLSLKIKSDLIIYCHDLDNHDTLSILKYNFSANEMDRIHSLKLWTK